MVDELRRRPRPSGRCSRRSPRDNPNQLYALEASADDGGRAELVRRALHPDGPQPIAARAALPRAPSCGFWRCTNERAQAQAVAREVEHLLAGGTAPEEICVLVDDPAGEGGAGRGGDGGARHPLPPRRAGGALPAARGARRDRLAAGARRPRRLGRRRRGR